MYFRNFPVCALGGCPGSDVFFLLRIDDFARRRTYAPNFDRAFLVPLSSARRTLLSSKKVKRLAMCRRYNVRYVYHGCEDVVFFQLILVEKFWTFQRFNGVGESYCYVLIS